MFAFEAKMQLILPDRQAGAESVEAIHAESADEVHIFSGVKESAENLLSRLSVLSVYFS